MSPCMYGDHGDEPTAEEIAKVREMMKSFPPHCEPGVGPDATGVATYTGPWRHRYEFRYDGQDLYQRVRDGYEWEKLEE